MKNLIIYIDLEEKNDKAFPKNEIIYIIEIIYYTIAR